MGAHSALLFTGGLAAVIYTDALQTLIMVLGAIVLAVRGRCWEDHCAPLASLGQSQINKLSLRSSVAKQQQSPKGSLWSTCVPLLMRFPSVPFLVSMASCWFFLWAFSSAGDLLAVLRSPLSKSSFQCLAEAWPSLHSWVQLRSQCQRLVFGKRDAQILI